jgi:geranylgeranyl pyrophosphate synthase
MVHDYIDDDSPASEYAISEIVRLMEKKGSFDYSYRIARSYSSRAKHSLTGFDVSRGVGKSLEDLCDFVVERDW